MREALHFFEQRKARRWLREREITARLPRPGRRLLIRCPDPVGDVVIERVEHHTEGRILRRYLICAAGASR